MVLMCALLRHITILKGKAFALIISLLAMLNADGRLVVIVQVTIGLKCRNQCLGIPKLPFLFLRLCLEQSLMDILVQRIQAPKFAFLVLFRPL